MGHPETAIPEKIFFKIGEVCDLVGVQAHVLRYWETEFPMLSRKKTVRDSVATGGAMWKSRCASKNFSTTTFIQLPAQKRNFRLNCAKPIG
jgi:hypothetical protein